MANANLTVTLHLNDEFRQALENVKADMMRSVEEQLRVHAEEVMLYGNSYARVGRRPRAKALPKVRRAISLGGVPR